MKEKKRKGRPKEKKRKSRQKEKKRKPTKKGYTSTFSTSKRIQMDMWIKVENLELEIEYLKTRLERIEKKNSKYRKLIDWLKN